MKIAGVILAGGKGSRMGGVNKAMLPFAGTTLAEWTVGRLKQQVDVVGLNANRDLEQLSQIACEIVPDGLGKNLGPLDGILGAMRFAKAHDCTHVVTMPVDTPLFPDDLVETMLANLRNDLVVCAGSGSSIHCAVGLWPTILSSELAGFLNSGKSLKVWDFLVGHLAPILLFDYKQFDPFFNINSPEDLAFVTRSFKQIN